MYVACQEHSIVFYIWSDKLWATSLSYFIGLLTTFGFENVFVFKSWCHSIYIYDNYVGLYLSGIPIFISMHLSHMYLHAYAFSHVSCVIYYRVYYFYFYCTVYDISQQSSILHILYNYHPKILVLKTGWSLINCKDFTYVGKALGLTVYRLLIFCCDPITYFIISYILNDTVHISGLFCVIFKTFCLIVINWFILTKLIFLRSRNKSYFASQKLMHTPARRQPGASYAQRSPWHTKTGFRYARASGDKTLLGHLWPTDLVCEWY